MRRLQVVQKPSPDPGPLQACNCERGCTSFFKTTPPALCLAAAGVAAKTAKSREWLGNTAEGYLGGLEAGMQTIA